MFQIQPRENSADAIKRVIREEIDESVAALSNPAVYEDEIAQETAVHDTRKSLKRIRAALRLVRDEIGEAIFDRENADYRDAARHLALLRDSAVMVETLDLARAQYDSDAFEAARQKLFEIKEDVRQQFLQEAEVIPTLVERLTRARARVGDLPIQMSGFQAYQEGLRRVYRRGRLRMMRAYKDGESAEKFHDWRKRVKYLWHHMEFFQPLWPTVFETAANELHQLSDYLGEAHDTAVLADYIRENSAEFAHEPALAQLLQLLSEHRRKLELAAQPLGQRLYAEKPKQFVRRIEVYWDVWQEYEEAEKARPD